MKKENLGLAVLCAVSFSQASAFDWRKQGYSVLKLGLGGALMWGSVQVYNVVYGGEYEFTTYLIPQDAFGGDSPEYDSIKQELRKKNYIELTSLYLSKQEGQQFLKDPSMWLERDNSCLGWRKFGKAMHQGILEKDIASGKSKAINVYSIGILSRSIFKNYPVVGHLLTWASVFGFGKGFYLVANSTWNLMRMNRI